MAKCWLVAGFFTVVVVCLFHEVDGQPRHLTNKWNLCSWRCTKHCRRQNYRGSRVTQECKRNCYDRARTCRVCRNLGRTCVMCVAGYTLAEGGHCVLKTHYSETTATPALNDTLGTELISAVATFGSELYVTFAPKEIDQIAVYNKFSLQLLRYITVPGANGYLVGFAICPSNNFLYMSDYDNNMVFRFNLPLTSTSVTTMIKWSVAQRPNGLSVNRLNNVLVACESKKIQEYSPSGSLVREVLDDNSVNHAVEVNDGILAISSYGPVHGVSLIDYNDIILHRYGSDTPGSDPGQMNYPGMLAVNNEGFILVTDGNNNRVLVLNPTLSEARTLSLPPNIAGPLSLPFAMWLDSSTGWLYVGEFGSPYRLIIFDNISNIAAASTPVN